MRKDWTGNDKAVYSTLGASNHSEGDRQSEDFYATEPKAAEMLLDIEDFGGIHTILEPACGMGHLSKVFEADGRFKVISTDLFDRGYGISGRDFFSLTRQDMIECEVDAIITNPPYKQAQEFVEHAMDIIPTGGKVMMFLKVQFLEGKGRKELFRKYPPVTVHISSSRLLCAKNGVFDSTASSAVAYAWFVWENRGGRTVDIVPRVRWFN